MVMIKCLNVAEKPSVAKELAQILGAGHPSRRDGLSPYNPIWELPHNFDGSPATFCITSVTGHLMEIDFDENHKGWSSCDPIALFEAPINKRVPETKLSLMQTLVRESRTARFLILWLDCDREGENISFEVMEVCTRENPRLQIKRAHFSSLAPAEVHRALTTLTPPNEFMSLSVDARQEIDLRLGAAFTRFQTFRLKKFTGQGELLSWGPCQFPTLGFVVDRYWKRESFVVENFWYIEVTATRNDCTTTFHWKRVRLFDRLPVLILYEMVMEAPTATVTSVTGNPKRKWRPLPLATVELQKLASTKLRIASEETMKIAEELYQQGFISYPRTETDKFPPDMNLRDLIDRQRPSPVWGEYASMYSARWFAEVNRVFLRLLDGGGFRAPRAGKHSDEAHPPIHPTSFTTNLTSEKHKKIYDLVVRHFLACCSEDAIGHETKVVIEIASEVFSASGLMIHSRNYLDIYPFDRWTDSNIGVFEPGETFSPTSILMSEGRTTPPTLLTEAELLTLMDRHGIGTDATMHEHISKIQQRNYATKHNQFFEPTPLGRALVAGYEAMGFELARPFIRSRMEADMREIAVRTKHKEQVVSEWMHQMKAVYQEIQTKVAILDSTMAQHFRTTDASSWHQTARNFSECGNCHSLMNLMQEDPPEGTRALFCPGCRRTLVLPRSAPSTHEQRCVLCGYQVLSFVRVETGNRHTLCPYCFNNPPVNQKTATDTFASGFRCFQCSANCPLATKMSSEPVRHCTQCPQSMMLKKWGPKKFGLQCSNAVCPKLLLSSTEAASVVANARCARGWPILQLILDRSAPPQFHSPLEGCCCGCPGDVFDFLEFFNENKLGSRNGRGAPPPPPPAPPSNGMASLSSSADTKTDFKKFMVAGATQPGPMPVGIRGGRGGGPTPGTGRGRGGQQAVPGSGGGRGSGQNSGATSWSSHAAGDDVDGEVPHCAHGLPAIVLTCRQGANEGRKFYKCNQLNKCDVFVWMDEQQHGGGGGGGGGGRGGTGGAGAGGGCFTCGQPGHYASACPNRQGFAATGGGRGSGYDNRAGGRGGGGGGWQQQNNFGAGMGGAGSNTSTGLKCYKCNRPGHFANACPGESAPPEPTTGKGRGKSKAASSSGDTPAARKCSVCKQTGHNKKNCPRAAILDD